MEYVKLGKTDIKVNKNGFGALPIQRATYEESEKIIKKAFENKITFFDTARAYSNSEDKLAKALKDIPREEYYLASKSQAETVDDFKKDLKTSLDELQTDYLDLYQFHNLPFVPYPDEENGLYDAMCEAKEEGLIKHIGITSHKYTLALEAIDSGLYETLQFPFSHITGVKELDLVEKCEKNDIGFLAMKAMAGGLINNSKAAYAFMRHFKNVLPIWGIQKMSELDEFLSYQENPPTIDDEINKAIQKDRKELGINFCRGCGYCMPCPEEIEINFCVRMSLWIRRFPTEPYLTEKYVKMMEKTENCTECLKCIPKCPYEIDIPKLLKENHEDYFNILNGKTEI